MEGVPRMRVIVCSVAVGLFLFPTVGCHSQKAGVERARALFRGDNTVLLAAISENDYTGAWRDLFTEPEGLRYIERCLVSSSDDVAGLGGGTTIKLRLKFQDGEEVDAMSYWRKGGFVIYLPGTYAGDGERPDGRVLFREPMPAGMRNIIRTWNLQ